MTDFSTATQQQCVEAARERLLDLEAIAARGAVLAEGNPKAEAAVRKIAHHVEICHAGLEKAAREIPEIAPMFGGK